MTHVYLNETAIKDALKAKAITEREARELAQALKTQRPVRSRTQERMAS